MATAKGEALIGIDLGGTKVAAGNIHGGALKELLYQQVPAESEDLLFAYTKEGSVSKNVCLHVQ